MTTSSTDSEPNDGAAGHGTWASGPRPRPCPDAAPHTAQPDTARQQRGEAHAAKQDAALQQNREARRWQVRGRLEMSGLRVVSVLPVPGRPDCWYAHVLAHGVTCEDLAAAGDVVRVSLRRGTPDLLVLTLRAGDPDQELATVGP